MVDPEFVTAVKDALAVSHTEFQTAVAQEAATLAESVTNGEFDNSQGQIGLEYEFYAVRGDEPHNPGQSSRSGPSGALCRVPRQTLSYTGFEAELGLHNAEMCTMPHPNNQYGIDAQSAEIKARLTAAKQAVTAHDMRLVSDGIWTIPPVGETAAEYLGDSVEIDGLVFATNMTESIRYHAMSNTDYDLGLRIDVPNATFEADTVMPESLITSIQPHYQVPRAEALPEYFRYALRLAGPLLALGCASPFLPPSLYDDGVEPEAVLDEAFHEHRISIFETVLNGPDLEKVRFPADLTTTTEAIDRIVEDPLLVPVPPETTGSFGDQFAHFRHAHGSYWRWVRPVFGGERRSDAHVRIEFRPLPGQPTVQDAIALQAAFVAAIEGMYGSYHPVIELPWEVARENFYAAMHDGLDAELTWVTGDGKETTDTATLFDDLFAHVEMGMKETIGSRSHIDFSMEPLRYRVRNHITPAGWKLALARRERESGADLGESIQRTQRSYLQFQDETLLTDSFADWPLPSEVPVGE